MARKVKCYATGEYGSSDDFIYIDNHWYKSQEVHDKYMCEKMYYHKVYDQISDLLGYVQGQVFPTVVARKLKELNFYSYECIYETFKYKHDDIKYWIHAKDFTSDYQRVAYMFAIVKNNINDVYHRMQKQERQKAIARKSNDVPVETDIQSAPQKSRNISKWLEDDD